MPAKDRYHDAVIHALIKDGWKITGEQVKVIIEDRYLFIDIEATKAADDRIVLIEVKELETASSPVAALASALGQYFLYRTALADVDIQTPLYLAVPKTTHEGILSEKLGRLSIAQGKVSLVIFDPETEEIVQWIP